MSVLRLTSNGLTVSLIFLLFYSGSNSVSAQSVQERITALEKEIAAQKAKMDKLELLVMPIGAIVAFSGPQEKIPENWRLCNGDPMSVDTEPNLFNAIGGGWGMRTDATGKRFFLLPDLRGRFLRGVDLGTGRDPDREDRKPPNPNGNPGEQGNIKNNVGSMQDDQLQTHKHLDKGHIHPIELCCGPGAKVALHEGEEVKSGGGAKVMGNEGNNGFIEFSIKEAKASFSDPVASVDGGDLKVGAETRVKNAYVLWIIRVR